MCIYKYILYIDVHHTYLHVCVYDICVSLYAHMHVCKYACRHVSMHLCIYVSLYVCMYLCMHLCIYDLRICVSGYIRVYTCVGRSKILGLLPFFSRRDLRLGFASISAMVASLADRQACYESQHRCCRYDSFCSHMSFGVHAKT